MAIRIPARITKAYKAASMLSPKYFKSVAEIEKVLKLLESLRTLEGPFVEFLAENKWDYKTQGNDWKKLCPFGPVQSPIKISSEDTFLSSQCFIERYYPMSLHYSAITTSGRFTKRLYILHGNYGKLKIHPPMEDTPREFEAIQFHFHSPSEHIIDSVNCDLEMHLVHRDVNKKTINLVLGFMFKNTGKPNAFLQSSIDALDKSVEIDLWNLLEDEPQVYFYHGSLTTPPCNENILWFLTSKVHECDEKQLKFFSSRWAENDGFARGHGNNRDIQPLFNRPVIFFDK